MLHAMNTWIATGPHFMLGLAIAVLIGGVTGELSRKIWRPSK